jgi:signal transduction histidine kinase
MRRYDARMADLSRSGRGVLSVNAALIAGFTAVFGLWLLWAYQLVRGLDDIQARVTSAEQTNAEVNEVLSLVRTDVLLGSIYLRDALIDRDSPTGTHYRSELERLRFQSATLLEDYLARLESGEERREWLRLAEGLEEYWRSREVAFSPSQRSTLQSAQVLRQQVVPRRQHVLDIVDQLGRLQQAADDRMQRETGELHGEVRWRMGWMGAGTLIVALLVAASASRHAQRLQRQVERQRRSEQENRQDLERLSARLVDVQEQERRHLSRELHDAVGQALTAVKMDIGIALRAATEPRARAALEEAREITETTLRGVRDLSQLLHPSTLDDFGLPATLTAYLRSFSERTNIRAQLAETLEERLPSQIEVCVYRIVQEALNNIARHSGATDCTVSLGLEAGTLRLVIDDNGQGPGRPPAGTDASHGLGLIAMRERAQMFGGTFTMERGPGGGTRVSVTLPRVARRLADAEGFDHARTGAAARRPATLAR